MKTKLSFILMVSLFVGLNSAFAQETNPIIPIADISIPIEMNAFLSQEKSLENLSLEVTVSDSSAVADKLWAIDMMAYLSPETAYSMILDRFGDPRVVIRSEGHPTHPIIGRVRNPQWWESQNRFTALYSRYEENASEYLMSDDLESFETHDLGDTITIDGHAIELIDDGSILDLILTHEFVPDINDIVPGEDSIRLDWTEFHMSYGSGEMEYIPLSQYYDDLDVYGAVFTGIGGGGTPYLDPLHGNSLDYYKVSSSLSYTGATNRTPDEVLILKNEFGLNTNYHFGGPLNQFDTETSSAGCYKGHDFRILYADANTVQFSCYSNGSGDTVGADVAAGRIIELDLVNMEAELLEDIVLLGDFSNAMGSFDSETKTFAPGARPTSNGLSPVLALQLDEDEEEVMRIEHTEAGPRFCYQANRYDNAVLGVLKLPEVVLECNGTGTEITISAQKDGVFDGIDYIVDGVLAEGVGNEIVLDGSFVGEVQAVSSFWVSDYEFEVEKYSETVTIPENYCSLVLGIESVSSPFGYANGRITFKKETNGSILDTMGRVVKLFSGKDVSVEDLPSGSYTVASDVGHGRFAH